MGNELLLLPFWFLHAIMGNKESEESLIKSRRFMLTEKDNQKSKILFFYADFAIQTRVFNNLAN